MIRALPAIAASVLAAAAALAATTVENGYEVTRSQTLVPVPRGKVGRKTIDRETRTGNTPDTDGNSVSFGLTLGGFVNKCPVPEGTAPVRFVVAGEFEYSLILDTVDTDVVPTERKHYAKRVNLRLKAFVNDDLSITEAEFNGEYTADIEGVRTGPVPIHRRFRIGEGGMPDMSALKDIAVTSDLAAAALAWNASQLVLSVRSDLYAPNACAELQFDPPSETRAVGPGETVEIRVKYRSRDDQQPIPRGKWGAVAVEGGRVAESGGEVRADGSFVVKYTARSSSDPKEGDGILAEAGSAGGVGKEHWKIRVGGDYELQFESSIVSREVVQSVRSSAQGSLRLTASTKPWRRKPDGKLYRLYDGTGTVRFSSGPGPERDACAPLISGSGTSEFKVLETFIQVTPPSEQNGVRVAGKADVQMTYWIAMGAGETEMTPTNVNFQCVPGDVDALPFWWSAYLSGRDPDGDVNFLTHWEYVGQDGVVARKVLTGNCKGMWQRGAIGIHASQGPVAVTAPASALRAAPFVLAAFCAAGPALAQGMLGLAPGQGAAALRERADEHFTFVCPASEGSKANVYGTDVYTDDSAVCAAAIHAGMLKPGHSGIVTIRIGGGAKEFPGSKRNGVASRSYGAWPHSYTFVREEEPGAIAWSTVWNGIPADFWEPIAVRCPAGGATKWTIWGTDVYARDSAICVAAVHRGLITAEKGGLVVAKRAPGAKEFPGSVQNGIESKRWGTLDDAFIVASVGSAEPPPMPPPPPSQPPSPPPEEPPPPATSVTPRTIVLAGFSGTGPASQSGPILPRTIAITGFIGVGPASVSGAIDARIIHSPGWTGVGPAP